MVFNVLLDAKSLTQVTFYCKYTYILKKLPFPIIYANHAN